MTYLPKQIATPHNVKLSHEERHRFDDAVPFKIDGVYCKLIPLTQEKYSIVEVADYDHIMQWRWCARKHAKGCGFYAVRGHSNSDHKPRHIMMHRTIRSDIPKGRQVDHWNRVGLDNRRGNLRQATNQQNQANRSALRNNTSGFKGVSWFKSNKKWCAKIRFHGKDIWLGLHNTREAAGAAYQEANVRLNGEFACSVGRPT